MAAYQGVLLLFSGQEHGRSLRQGPPQLLPVFSMLASQTAPPGISGEAEHTEHVNNMLVAFHTYQCHLGSRSRARLTLWIKVVRQIKIDYFTA